MKPLLLALAALLLLGGPAFAQEDGDLSFTPYFALEIGTGIAPIHTLISNGTLGNRGRTLTEDGQGRTYDGAWCPSFSLSAAWHTSLRWEWAVTIGLSWLHHRAIRYEAFGIDPQGRNRYDLDSYRNIGWKDADFIPAVFFQARRFWNPTQKVKLYSALGLGYVFEPAGDFGIVPSVTPIAVRFGTGRLKFFIEHTFSPAATGVDVGLGWTF